MQSKGAIRLVVILLLLVSIWELSFTFVANKYEKNAAEYADRKIAALQADPEFMALPANKQDSIRTKFETFYMDSLRSKEVYFGYTLDQVQKKSLNLGLDLKGGMSVVLQIQMEDLVKALAVKPCEEFDTAFKAALSESEKPANAKESFINLFAEEWDKVKGDKSLSDVFKIDGGDGAVISALKSKAEGAVDIAYNVLSRRIDRFGVTAPSIQKVKGGNGRILIELPGVKDPARVRKLLQGTASLEFWGTFRASEILGQLVEADRIIAEKDASAKSLRSLLHYDEMDGRFARLGYAHYSDTTTVNSYLSDPAIKAVFSKGLTPMWSAKPMGGKGDNFELVAIKNEGNGPLLDGDAVEKASAQITSQGSQEMSVSMTMTRSGARKWASITEEHRGKQIAIVLDGLVYSYPNVNEKIEGGNSSITGNFTPDEAKDLATVLECGKLPAPAKIIQESVVGPSLGEKSINAGLISFIIAFILILIYMVLFYSRAGLAADIALLCNVVLLMGVLAAFNAVLTLPGIAGLVLTLGMAVDANVIIYERIKEELRAGKALNKAIADGYSNAYSAIIDGQITTFLTGLVLYSFGSGPVQGFAITLMVGIATSIVSSIFISRLYFEDRLAKGKDITFDNKFTRNFLQNTNFNFIGKRKIAYIVSGLLIIASLTSIFTKGFTYGVDFVGGRTYVVRFDQSVNTDDVRKSVINALNEAAAADPNEGKTSAEVKQFGASNQVKISTTYKTDAKGENVDRDVAVILYSALNKYYKTPIDTNAFLVADANNIYGIVSSEKVGAAIAEETKTSAIYSVIFALIVIFAYIAIRFRGWTWGLGGVIGLAHTALIVIGFFSIFTGILPFTLDIDQTFIAAILTIIGYAINDTVVIFDRIREFKKLHPKAEFKSNVNAAINSTLSRTMNTSLTTLVTMLAIAIFGGEAIRGLAVALILGIVIGTYASIFIATPIMYDLTRKADKKAAKKAAKNAAKTEQK